MVCLFCWVWSLEVEEMSLENIMSLFSIQALSGAFGLGRVFVPVGLQLWVGIKELLGNRGADPSSFLKPHPDGDLGTDCLGPDYQHILVVQSPTMRKEGIWAPRGRHICFRLHVPVDWRIAKHHGNLRRAGTWRSASQSLSSPDPSRSQYIVHSAQTRSFRAPGEKTHNSKHDCTTPSTT